MINKHKRASKAIFFCYYCKRPLFRWKSNQNYTVYKCDNDKCSCYLDNLKKLNPKEKALIKKRSSQFKLRYQYRAYHFKDQELSLSEPRRSIVDLCRIHNHSNLVGLILAFHVSFAVSARKTALILKQVFNIPISYQTVLNYAEASSYWCHKFNLYHKGSIDPFAAGDETYIRVMGKWAFTFLFIATESLKIIAYHIANNRGVAPAITAIREAIRTAPQNMHITTITDKNPAYASAVHFVNSDRNGIPLEHHNVVGLQNLDEESEKYRPYKQIVERLNRTYKFHVRPATGFASNNGAVSLTTLFVTHYNFLRPHFTLNGQTPVVIDDLSQISTIQDKWCKIIDMAMNLN